MTAMSAQDRIERITLRRVNRRFGYATVRLPGVHLSGLRVEERPDGQIVVRPPEQPDRHGQLWPVYALQPGAREDIERELAVLWARSS